MKANLAAAQLKAYESVIEAGQQTFVDVGQALAKIRDQRLFREAGFHSFDGYCRDRWGWQKAHANRLISAAEVAPMGATNERQARALRRVPERRRAEVMARVQESGEPVTAAAITETYERSHSATPQRAEPVCTHCPVHCP